MPKSLFVGNLHYDMDDRELEHTFLVYGKVKKARIVTNRDDGMSRGFGFVEMDTDAETEAALAADGIELYGRRIRVNYAREKSERPTPRGRGHNWKGN